MSTLNKILVVGAGVAGPAVCYWLTRAGFSPTLIERSASLRKGGQALDIRGVAVDLVKKMGIYEQICSKRTQIRLGRYVDPEGHLLHEEEGETFGFRQDEEVELLRGDLIDILMSTIPGIPVYFNHSISKMDQSNEGVNVYFKDGQSAHYDLVLGCDGIHSTTRRQVFDKEEYQLVNLGSYLSIFTIPNYLHLNHTQLLCESNQKQASITSDKDLKTAQAAFMFRSDRILEHSRDEKQQKQFLHEMFHDFGWEAPKMLELMSSTQDFYFDAITQVKMPCWTKGRVALIGDAGYCPSPLSGQGNNLAIVGAYLLAGELQKAKGDYAVAFDRYNQLLHPFVEMNQAFGAWVSQSFLVPDKVSKEVAEERSSRILKEIKRVSSGIVLPEYD